VIKKILTGALACALLFVVAEGLSSIVFVTYTLLSTRVQHRAISGTYIRFDDELGWVSVPNFFQADYYSPGAYLKTNSRGFRSDAETPEHVPAGKLRVICSGDSETFGDGVGNDRVWCEQFESLDSRIEAVNMGEVGYGVDQMYLKYKRYAAGLDRDVHLFALVTDDFRRMHYTVMGGYGKPVLTLRDGEIVASRAAVAERSAILHFLALKPNPLRLFRSITIASDAMDRIRGTRTKLPEVPTEEERRLTLKLIDDLAGTEKGGNGVLAVVYLPTRQDDSTPGGPSDLWRQFLREESPKRGVVFIDLVDDFEKLSLVAQDGLFIWQGFTENYPESVGHFDDQGHQYIARQIYEKMLAAPAIAGKLARLGCEGRASACRGF
jgi:hypothetical protein